MLEMSWLCVVSLLLASTSLATAKAQDAKSAPQLTSSNIPKVVPRAFQTKCYSLVANDENAWTLEQYHVVHPDPSHPYNWLSAWYIGGPRIWNWEPVCFHIPETGSHCVYTSTHFSEGRGYSLLTSPENEKQALRAQIFKDATAGVKPLIRGFGSLEVAESRIKRAHFANKGIGMVATETIHRGDIVYATTPLCSLSEVYMGMAPSDHKNLAIELAVERLPRASRDLYMSQIPSMGGNPYYDRADTNSFMGSVGYSTVRYWNIYPESARLNHDCRPVTSYTTNPNTMVHAMVALRTIYPGEEVTTSYMSPYYIWKDRQHRAQRYWGFNCTCNACAAPEHNVIDSDNRLLRINAIEKQLTTINFGSVNRTGWTERVELLVSLYKQERLYGAIAEAYALATFEYAYMANKYMTQKYAALALEALMLWRGAWNTEALRDIIELLNSPESNGFWNYAALTEEVKAAGNVEALIEAEKGFPTIKFGSVANGISYDTPDGFSF